MEANETPPVSGDAPAGPQGGEIVVYEDPDGEVRVDVRLERETLWLSLAQIAELFGRDKSVVSRHLRNVFSSGELEREATVAKNATVQQEGGREVVREIEHFNLDAILSVGYRVNSRRGTQFRIWATHKLRDHLLRGYTLNERRLQEQGLGEIEQAVELLARTLTAHELVTAEGQAVLEVVRQYTRAWRLLFEYDEDRLSETPKQPVEPGDGLELEDARSIIAKLRDDVAGRGEAGSLFGREQGEGLARILGSIEQTFDGKLSKRAGPCGPPSLLPHQGSPAGRREQAHRHAVVSRISAPQRSAYLARRQAPPPRQRDGGARSTDCGERPLAEGPDDPAGAQPA